MMIKSLGRPSSNRSEALLQTQESTVQIVPGFAVLIGSEVVGVLVDVGLVLLLVSVATFWNYKPLFLV